MAKKLNVPIQKITSGEHALRVNADDEEIAALGESILRVGLLNPLSVVKVGDNYLVIAGHRRLEACRRVGLETVPCIAYSGGTAKVKEISFAENMFRADLSAVEIAAGIADLYKSEIMGVKEIAGALHRSEAWVDGQISMLSWPDKILEAIHDRRISVAAARNLVAVGDDSYRRFLLDQAVANGATARVTAAWLQAWSAQLPAVEAVELKPAPAGERAMPALPQAPCICCGTVQRTDALSMVMICSGCIVTIRSAVQQS